MSTEAEQEPRTFLDPDTSLRACPPKPALGERPLLSQAQAAEVAGVFKVLAGTTRLRMLHALSQQRELAAGDLARCVSMRPQAVSNQLQRLVDQGILAARRSGTHVYYRIVDPCVSRLLDLGLCLAEDRAGPCS